MGQISILFTIILMVSLSMRASFAASLPAGFTETQVASGMTSPTAMAIAPDGRIFVCQQGGNLRVVKNNALLPTPFVTLSVAAIGERGLLGVAVDPNFAANQFVYVYYTVPTAPVHNRVSRFTADGDVALAGSESILLELDPLSAATNHNGGALHFGPDGRLYIAVGENANPSNAQSLGNLLGKLLRINADGTIPSDNPFFNQTTGNNRAIWALGLRNPFTFNFQKGTGRIFINDVGQNTIEEINDGIVGSNYGWPNCEGPCIPPNPNFRDPIYNYLNDATTCAITGGAFYNPANAQFPVGYLGKYFFADFCGGWIRTLDPATNMVDGFATGISFPVDLQVGSDGSLYYLQRGGGGQLWRIQYPTGPVAAPAQYYPLPKPIRLLDTRPGEPGCDAPGAPLTGGNSRTQPARLTCDGVTIPTDAVAVVGNATAVNILSSAEAGYITLYPSGAAQPTVSNLNYLPGQIIPNSFTVGLGSDGAFNIFTGSETHFIVDITGYYAPPGAGGLYFHPLPKPIRLLDTRSGETACATPEAPLTGGSTRTQTARLTCDGVTIPANAQAISGNATVVNFISPGGFITLYPSGAQLPTVSNLNFTAHQIIPNAFTVGLGSDGAFNIFASSATDLLVDVTGYYSPDQADVNGTGLLYQSLARPLRLLDTRPGEPACDTPGAPLTGGDSRTQTARVFCNGLTVPNDAQAIVSNGTIVNFISPGGFITLFPSDAAQPTVSNMNYLSNQIIPNAFTLRLGNDGAFKIFASGSTHFIVDLTGYFTP